ncbi:MAG: class I SAM-dependent methyltransferase [Proteobacteria bacterium]|nr:class I SAM-dependent methyltransferase [Pseudomonadota bacterium]
MGILSPIIKEYLTPELSVLQGTVLDVGCGDQPYRELMSGVDSYIAMDWNVRESLLPDQLRNCFVRGSALELPFMSESFDAVLASQLLEHMGEPQRLMLEIWRVLKKGGKGILTFPLVNPVHEAPYDFTRFTEYGILHLIEKANFSLEKTIPMGGGWLTVGFLIYHQLCWHGDQCTSQRAKTMLYRLGQMVYRTFQKVDKRWITHDLPVNYLSVFRKN